jgi:uncharacterized protein (DUF58 family)
MPDSATIVAPKPVSSAFTPATMAALAQVRLRVRSLASAGHQGRRRSTARGRSLEFADYRHYAPGDDPRDLDWNAVARFDALLVRLFHAEVALPLHVYLDGSASMHWGKPLRKFVAGLRMAAGLALIAAQDDTPVDVHVPGAAANGSVAGNGVVQLRRRAGFAGLLGRLDELAGAAPVGAGLLGDELKAALRRRAGQTVVVITDGYEAEAVLPLLGQLRAAGAEVDVVQVLDPEELRPSIVGDFALEDVESGEQVRITVDEKIRESYRRRVTRFVAGWSAACRRRGIGHALVSSDVDVGPALASALVKAGTAM